jgi:hypothetical protein
MKMIHPQYWSLSSIYYKLRYGFDYDGVAMNDQDKEAYSMLDVEGKVVLDVGAYVGDSAKLFLERGARKVIAIEINKEWADSIKLPNTVVINQPFDLDHLELSYDCMKMDIEGTEAVLLGYKGVLKPSVIEVHTQYLIDRFEEIGFVKIHEPEVNFSGIRYCLMRNFKEVKKP